jgi:hypothetical protein
MNQAVCKYQFRDKKTCGEAVAGNSEYCFWHDPELDRSGVDIKRRLEEAHKNGKRLEGFNLHQADLSGINLTYANLADVNFKRANLRGSHFFGTDISGANLFKANLDGANFKQSNLVDAELLGVRFGDASMENANFGNNFVIKNEIEGNIALRGNDIETANEKYFEAYEIYLNIKNNFRNRGLSEYGGKFFYREMIMQRRLLPSFSGEKLWSTFMDFATGYGEKPHRIIRLSLLIILGFTVIFGFTGLAHFSGSSTDIISSSLSLSENLAILYDTLYFSVITFTTVGYGDFAPLGLGKMFAAIEAICGYFVLALFITTIFKRYMNN